MLDQSSLPKLVSSKLWPRLERERERLDRIDAWWRFDHDKPHQPTQPTSEYRELTKRAQTPYLQLVVTAVAQQLYVDGYRRAKDPEDAAPWAFWQANGMDARQMPIHRAALAYGLAYETVLPGKTLKGARMPVMRGVSPRRMIAFYDDPVDDDWPAYALRADPKADASGWNLRVYDEKNVYYLACGPGGSGVVLVETEVHDAGVCPVVRFANMLDLEGRADGEVEGLIPLQGRIDQGIFDRLVVQRFASWNVRTVTGMDELPGAKDPENPTQQERDAAMQKLRVSDILAGGQGTTFGTLPASPLNGFIDAHTSDVKDLAAVSQTAPHHLLGDLVNLSAEALAAADTGATRKKMERQYGFGESHEQSLRLAAVIMNDDAAANDMEAQVRWRDVESRSLAQAADALGKLATMLKVPVQLLWEKIPSFTQQDVERAKDLLTESSGIDMLLQKILDSTETAPAPAPALPASAA